MRRVRCVHLFPSLLLPWSAECTSKPGCCCWNPFVVPGSAGLASMEYIAHLPLRLAVLDADCSCITLWIWHLHLMRLENKFSIHQNSLVESGDKGRECTDPYTPYGVYGSVYSLQSIQICMLPREYISTYTTFLSVGYNSCPDNVTRDSRRLRI